MIATIQHIHPRSLKYLSVHLQRLVAKRLWAKVLIGLVLGIITGILLGPSVGLVARPTAAIIGNWLALPGQLFLVLIQMIVVPLVFASVIRGLAASENIEQLKRLGIFVVVFFIITTVIAIIIGVNLALLIKPGNYVDSQVLAATVGDKANVTETAPAGIGSVAEIPEMVIGLLPTNPLNSMVESEMLQVVLFSVIFGIAILMTAPDRSRPLLEFLGSLQEVCMTVVRGAMWLAPIAVFGLIAQLTSRIGLEALMGMAIYMFTVLLGLGLMLLFYLLLLFVTNTYRPFEFLKNSRDVILLAFSTSSSAAVMPLSIKTAEDKLGVRPSIAQFIVPIGATINMNGTALYQGVATIFLAQVFGIDISAGGMVILIVVAVGASIGSPATPGVGIIILSMILTSVGVPPSGIVLIMGVDRIIDMCRTSVNVTGDLVACVVMNRWIKSDRSLEEEMAEEDALEQERADTASDVIIKQK
ncbi:MAG TPA: dicarboxylate/amino acid:cation symporter [Gammaproteobacteria bacterium]|nr:dicarboxylate/amino acid:cation symporter [Gammaproteobacteria bacterium]